MYAKSEKYQNLALFDFDGTLCKKDSFTGFIFYALSKRHIVKQGIKILPWIQAYYLNIYPADAMRIKLFKAMFTDANAHEIHELAQDYAQRLMMQLDPHLYQQLKKHQQCGDQVVLVSASIDLYLNVICELLQIDLICTKTEVKNQKLTGNYISPDCSSEQKRQRILDQYDLNQYHKIYAYGNSIEDLAMLNLADYKYMVGENAVLPLVEEVKQWA